MLPIYNSESIRAWDEYTILNEPIASIDLMERAALECLTFISKKYKKAKKISLICGQGNNGGDGLALARMLMHTNKEVMVYIGSETNRSPDNQTNLERLQGYGRPNLKVLKSADDLILSEETIVLDCIFGTGINKPVQGFWADIISKINNSGCHIISIDLPSGLPSEPLIEKDKLILANPENVIKANITLSFQVPKLSMMIPSWGEFCGKIEILDIGLSQEFIKEQPTQIHFVDFISVQNKFKLRNKFSHKGNYGHALLLAGNTGTCGAGILSANACRKSGAGLVSLFTSENCISAMHTAVPEIMIVNKFEQINFKNYQAIGIGPGIGINEENKSRLKELLKLNHIPLVLDADALNILSSFSEYSLPTQSILTPHPKEFDRLAGPSENAWQRLEKARLFAKQHQVVLVLKGAYTAICSPDAQLYFNSSGNPGMATAGSGDVLTGIILAFLAQGYSSEEAAILGVYCHGLAGDLAAESLSETGLVAGDLIDYLNPVFKVVENK